MSMRKKILNSFRKSLPPLSQSEKEALEVGTVGWDGELLNGSPNWEKLFSLNKPQLTPEEQAFVDGPTTELCKMLDNWQIQKDDDLPPEAWKFIKEKGFMGIEIPKEYGGLGFSSQAHSAIVMKLSSRSITGAITVMVPNSLGPAELIHEYGTKEQKEYYLPRLAKGEEIPCFALTGPEAGSDATSIPDLGVVCKNEKGELGIRLNWEKRYITLGPIATLIGLAFKLEDPDNLLGKDKVDHGITVALIKRDTPGVEIGERHAPMDIPFLNGPNRGKDVFIPLENIIGGPDRAGQGWRMLMECLAVGRALSLPAQSTAAAKFSSQVTGAYTRVRRQFNSPISKFEGIEEVLGRMAGETYMMNAARTATVQMVDQGERPTVPSAIVKYHLTEKMRKIVNDSMDVHGGKGICNGPNNYLANMYKGVPIAITVEGANIMTRNLIIFGQGGVLANRYIVKELEAANDKDDASAWRKMVSAFRGHFLNGIKSTTKSLWYGVTGGRGGKIPKGVEAETKKYYKTINRLSASFNLAADTTLARLGGGLKRRERVSARLGDVYSNLYLASTVLWYYEKTGQKKEDLPLVHWACTKALYDAEQALDKALKNHPDRMLGKLLRPFIFPAGLRQEPPTDKMDAKAADIIREPGQIRNRLTDGIFTPLNENEPLAKLELAFRKSVETEPLEKKLSQAQKDGIIMPAVRRIDLLESAKTAGVLTDGEYRKLIAADAIRREVIMVDAFEQKKPEAEKKAAPAAPGPKQP